MENRGILVVEVTRAGSVDETLQFLIELQDAYENLYALNLKIENSRKAVEQAAELVISPRRSHPPPLTPTSRARDVVPPEDRMIIRQVNIQSPGLWEFLASLNPLLQLREYLKDRHERRKDIEWREAEQHREMILENQNREQNIQKTDLETIQMRDSILAERIKMLLSLGYTEEQVRRLIIRHYFGPLSYLDHHYESGLITSIDVKETKP